MRRTELKPTSDYLCFTGLDSNSLIELSIKESFMSANSYQPIFQVSIDNGKTWDDIILTDEWDNAKEQFKSDPYSDYDNDINSFCSVKSSGNGTGTITTLDIWLLCGSGSHILLRGCNNGSMQNTQFVTPSYLGRVVASGNIMSLVYYELGEDMYTVGARRDITKIPNDNCFDSLFMGCTKLVAAPDLPVTDFNNTYRCYQSMFEGCTSLVLPPVLPAMTLKNYCYHKMFKDCTSLVKVPTLPATTLAGNCYREMFNGCTALTTPPRLPATTLAASCYRLMFSGCTNLVTAPVLPAPTTASGCYYQMFYNCSKLNYVKALFTNAAASSVTNNWLYGVAATGTFVKHTNTAWSPASGASGIPSGWTVQTATS